MRVGRSIQVLSLFAASMFFLGIEEVRTRSAQNLLTRSLEIPAPSRSFVEMDSGDKKIVEFRVENPSALPVRLLGSNYLCYRHGCLEVLDVPATIPPFLGRSVRVRVTATQPGFFTGGIDVFTDVPGQRTVQFEVQGSIVESPTASRRPKDADPQS